jgi:hypothetical protein
MDEGFSLIAAQMPRTCRISPFGIRLVAMSTVATTLLIAFAMFVSAQQRAADVRRSTMAEQQEAAREAEMRAAAQEATAAPATLEPSPDAVDGLLDTRAREAASAALETAMQVAASSSIDQALPATLSTLNHEVVFVDGPSTAPSIVSVFASAAGWSAAVHGSDHTCYWVALGAGGHARYGTGSRCTGRAALAADRPSW